MLNAKNGQLLALLAIAGLLGYAFFMPTAESSNAAAEERLADAQSGVAASLLVHTAIIGPEGATYEGTDVEFEPTAPITASFVALSMDRTILPLNYNWEDPGCTVMRATIDAVAADSTGKAIITGYVSTNSGGVRDVASRIEYASLGFDWVNAGTVKTGGDGKFSYTHPAVQPGASLRFVASREGYCTVTSNTVLATGPGSAPPPPNNPPAPPPPPSASHVNLPVSVSGTLLTKNLSKPVQILIQFDLKTATGITKQLFASAQVPAAGGALAPTGVTFAELPLSALQGANTIRVEVIASSADLAGRDVSEKQTVTVEKKVDSAGSISMTIKPASILTTTITGTQTTTRSSTLKASLV